MERGLSNFVDKLKHFRTSEPILAHLDFKNIVASDKAIRAVLIQVIDGKVRVCA